MAVVVSSAFRKSLILSATKCTKSCASQIANDHCPEGRNGKEFPKKGSNSVNSGLGARKQRSQPIPYAKVPEVLGDGILNFGE